MSMMSEGTTLLLAAVFGGLCAAVCVWFMIRLNK